LAEGKEKKRLSGEGVKNKKCSVRRGGNADPVQKREK